MKTEWNRHVLYRNSSRSTPMVADQLSTKKGTTYFLKIFTLRPKPPEFGFCPTGGLRRDRAHRVKVEIESKQNSGTHEHKPIYAV
ncbi:hypothetical protein AVEN_36175-1 [Araneus ventricosus]|uniref:Uncharacterized protein n=1 Tax=Araneus ventricosus TaxID=182803 RepID=A0A4Y2PQK7_ARAVE|nr:hypothetical protein AVEN_36175-1 [Araneus ventricosus]